MKVFTTLMALTWTTCVAGHGYLYIPSSRTRLGNEVCQHSYHFLPTPANKPGRRGLLS